MCLDLVIPAKNVPLGIGVKISPSLTINIFAVAVSATFPFASVTRAFEKPFDLTSASILALFGYKQPALALTTLSSKTGLLNLVLASVAETLGDAIGISSRQIEKAVLFSFGRTNLTVLKGQ